MGYCRNYHGYYFDELPQRELHSQYGYGSVFGPSESHAIDMMHVGMHGIYLIDDREYKVGQFFQKPGDKIAWLYDLGDQFRHKIVVESVEDVTGDDEIVEVLAGEKAGPPEDGHGNWRFSKDLEVFLEGPKNKKYYEIFQQFNHAANYKHLHSYDFHKFSLKECNREVMNALSSKTSAMDDSNMIAQNFQTGQQHLPKFKEKIRDKRNLQIATFVECRANICVQDAR